MPRLLVPITVDALVVRAAGGTWAETAWRPVVRPAAGTVRSDLAAPPFADRAQPRPPGVHLHVAVPDALATADQNGAFPVLPSRWIVVRLSGTGATRSVTTWLLPNIHDPASVAVRDGHTQPAAVGPLAAPVTVRGPGADGPHPSWSLTSDDTDGRLAFHDPLDHPDDDATGPLAYLVAGWYTHTQLDPLTPPPGRPLTWTHVHEVATRLRWNLDPDTDESGPPPDGIVCHGAALGIAWPGTTWPGDDAGAFSAESGGPPDPLTVRAAVGDTLAAATAVLLDDGTAPDALPLREAVLTGAVDGLDTPDGLARLDARRHQERFVSVARSGSTTDVVYVEDGGAAGQDVPDPVARAVAADQPAAVAAPLTTLFGAVHGRAAPTANAAGPGEATGSFRTVQHPLARSWRPTEPVVALAGLLRSVKHGADGRYDAVLDELHCRLTGATLTAFGPEANPPAGADALPEWAPAADVPDEIGALVVELAALDPGSVPGLAALPPDARSDDAAARVAWWATWTGDWTMPPAGTAAEGGFPSPVAVTPPSRPWTPAWVDWEIGWIPSPGGLAAWRLDELDLVPLPAATADAVAAERRLRGRGYLASAPVELVRSVAGTEPGVADLDLLAAGLTGVVDRIRGVPPGIWVGTDGIEDEPDPAVVAAEQYPAAPLAAGTWRITRLRVVDGYGQELPLVDVDAGLDPAVPVPDHLVAEGGGWLFTPRLTAPAIVEFRMVDPNTAGSAPITPGQRPGGGWLVTSPLDRSLEVLDRTGRSVGRLRRDPLTGRSGWEDAPVEGAAPVVGPIEERLPDDALRSVVTSVLEADRIVSGADRDGALDVLTRIVDTAAASVDVTGRIGNSHLALLLGRPLMVVRVSVKIDVDDPQSGARLADLVLPFRLGSLVRLSDGVCAYWVEDRPGTVHAVAGAADGVDGPYLAADPVVSLRPGEPRLLTVLVAPGADLTCVTGLLPQKQIEMLREWTEAPLAELSLTVAYDAVLRDAAVVVPPVPPALPGTWRWLSRAAPAAVWSGEKVADDPPEQTLGDLPTTAADGHLRFVPAPPAILQGTQFTATCAVRDEDHVLTHLSGPNPDGTVWRLPVAKVVELIDSGRFRFFAAKELPGGVRHQVPIVARSSSRGNRYLQTVADFTTENNLAWLQDCL
jgi:hypothetical protein